MLDILNNAKYIYSFLNTWSIGWEDFQNICLCVLGHKSIDKEIIWKDNEELGKESRACL